MELPILDLLEAKKEHFDYDENVDFWRKAIEVYAPGYLEMEADGNGMAPDYDDANFRSDEELDEIEDDDIDKWNILR